MAEHDWQKYYEKTKNRPPRPLLVRALERVVNKNEALDLGSGALNDARYLISVGFNHVTAVDGEPVAPDALADFPEGKLTCVTSTFDDFFFAENTYDLVNAQYSLPFSPPSSFDALITRIYNSLKPGGIFAGQLFGTNDEWNTKDTKMTFHKIEQAKAALAKFTTFSFEEEEADKTTAAGTLKHWHVFHFIVEK